MFLRELVASFHRTEYGTGGMAFEHGRAGACLSVGSDTLHCFHAHLCCYPSSAQLWHRISDLPVFHVDNIAQIAATTAGMPYLYTEAFVLDEDLDALNPDREVIHAAVALLRNDRPLTSQYLRRL